MSRALLSSCAMCSLVRMAPRSLSALASLQHGPYYFVLGKTMWPMPLIKELPSMLRGTATIRPIATSAIRRSDEEKWSTIDNTAMHGLLQHQAASEVNMKKAGEKFVKKAAVIQGKKLMEQTETEREAAKKAATEKAAVKKEAAARKERVAAEKGAGKKAGAKKTAAEKEASKKATAEKAAAKKEVVKIVAAEKAAAKKALAAVKKAAKEEATSKKDAMKASKRKTTPKVVTKKTQEKLVQKIDVTEKATVMNAKQVVKKDAHCSGEQRNCHYVAAFDNDTEKTSDLAADIVNTVDPIQQLFLASIRSYRRSEGLVAAGDAAQDELKAELERVAFRFGFQASEDTTTFPKFEFSDQSVDPIDIFQ